MVADITIERKRLVTLMILKLYNKNIESATPNVKPTACRIIFG